MTLPCIFMTACTLVTIIHGKIPIKMQLITLWKCRTRKRI